MVFKKYSNQEIADGILRQSPKVYRYLDSKFRERVIKYVGHNSGSSEDGEELFLYVVHEIFVNIKHGKYDADRGTFAGYFMTITKRRWIDRLRKQKKYIPTDSLDDINAPEISDYDEAELVAEEMYYIQVRAVKKHIKRLKEEEQEFIRMYYFAQQSLRAIAEHFGITEPNARVRHLRIKGKLRSLIQNDPEFATSLF